MSNKRYSITIEYCVPWNYLPYTARAVEEILGNYQHVVDDLKLITGSKGVFDVKVNGELIYSKHQTGRHTKEGEVLELFTNFVGSDVPRYGK